jgi:hypothetical protein
VLAACAARSLLPESIQAAKEVYQLDARLMAGRACWLAGSRHTGGRSTAVCCTTHFVFVLLQHVGCIYHCRCLCDWMLWRGEARHRNAHCCRSRCVLAAAVGLCGAASGKLPTSVTSTMRLPTPMEPGDSRVDQFQTHVTAGHAFSAKLSTSRYTAPCGHWASIHSAWSEPQVPAGPASPQTSTSRYTALWSLASIHSASGCWAFGGQKTAPPSTRRSLQRTHDSSSARASMSASCWRCARLVLVPTQLTC